VKANPDKSDRTSLRLKYDRTRMGLMLPTLLEQRDDGVRKAANTSPVCSLFETMKAFFGHSWHLNYVFAGRNAMPEHPLLYLIASSTWTANLSVLSERIKKASFRNIRSPRTKTISDLHDMREELDVFQRRVNEAIRFAPEGLKANLNREGMDTYFSRDASWRGVTQSAPESPITILEKRSEEAATLHAFLMDSFNMLLSSLSIKDSRRANLVTWLAFVYAILSFVTGIFGM